MIPIHKKKAGQKRTRTLCKLSRYQHVGHGGYIAWMHIRKIAQEMEIGEEQCGFMSRRLHVSMSAVKQIVSKGKEKQLERLIFLEKENACDKVWF